MYFWIVAYSYWAPLERDRDKMVFHNVMCKKLREQAVKLQHTKVTRVLIRVLEFNFKAFEAKLHTNGLPFSFTWLLQW